MFFGVKHFTSFAPVKRAVETRWFAMVAGLMLCSLLGSSPAAGTTMKLSAQTHFSQGWNTKLIDTIAKLGIDEVRDSVPWGRVETTPGRYDFSHWSAGWVDLAMAKGIAVTLAFNPVNKLHDDGHSIYTDAGRAAFAQFVVAVVKEYPGLAAIEIGNEYNGNSFVKGPIASAPISQRDEYYAKLLDAVDKALDHAGLEVKVVAASTHSIPVDYIADLVGNGVLEDSDGISIHPYTTAPEQLADQLAILRQEIGDKPIYVTEFGDNFETLAEAAPYLAKMVSTMAAAGVESANWYAFAKQSTFKNMELYDPKSGQLTPAGVTFQIFDRMLEATDKVEKIGIDEYTYFYSFGPNAAVIWGEQRSIALDEGVSAFDLAGKRITDLFSISPDMPIILRSTSPITADSFTLGASTILADSFHDFDAFNQGGDLAQFEGPWSYFAKGHTGQLTVLETMGGGLAGGESWTPYLGTNWLRPFHISDGKVVPADFNPAPGPQGKFATVERYTADYDGTVTIKGHWDVADSSKDGVKLTILLNNKIIFTKTIFDKSNGHVFDLELTGIKLATGDKLDFEIDSRENATGDVTERRITIHAEGALPGATTPATSTSTSAPSGRSGPAAGASACSSGEHHRSQLQKSRAQAGRDSGE